MDLTNDTHDRNFDANLRAMAPHVHLPPAPRPEELAAFRGGSGPTASQPALTLVDAPVPAMRRPRSRWLALGSAMAACIAIGTVAFTLTGSRVQASTILGDLRSRQISGVNLTFNKLSSEGVTIDGTVRMRMRRPVAVDQMADDKAGWQSGDFAAMHARMHIETSADMAGLPNAQLDAEVAFSPEVGWVFVQASDETIDQVVGAAPEAAMFANMARNGLILNIGKIDPELFEQLGMGEINELEAAREQAREARDRHAKGQEPKVTMESSVGVQLDPASKSGVSVKTGSKMSVEGRLDDLTDEQIESINKASDEFERMTGESQNRLEVSRDARGKRSVSVSAGANSKGAALGISVDGQPRSEMEAGIENIARSMLSGKARQQELDQLKSYLIGANQHATVRNLGGGRYELVADLQDDNAEIGAPSKATLTVNYEEQGGVQWAELSNMEDATGSIRFEFASDPIDPALLDYQRLVKVGQTNYVDVRSMLKMFGAGLGGGE